MKLEYITKLLVLVTVLLAFLFLGGKKKLHIYTKCILTLCILTELCGLLLKSCICSCYSISFIFHNTLWLLVLREFYTKSWFNYIVALYVAFSAYNLFFIEGINNLNYNIFIVGAFLYVIFFVYLSFYQLKIENLNFFSANSYILLSAPVMFFLGLSFLFGFGDLLLLRTKILMDVDVYGLIQAFINGIYYIALIVYIMKEKKKLNV